VPPRGRAPRAGRAALLVVALLAAAGCERRPDLARPKTFDEGGLSFAYPGNWKLKAETSTEGAVSIRSITIDSPGAAVVMIEEFKPAIEVQARKFVDELLQQMDKLAGGKSRGLVRVEGLATRPVQQRILGATRAGQRYGFRMTVLGEKVPHTIDAYSVMLDDRTLVLITQAPDEDVRKVEAGFAQILGSVAVK
jgi:hypothetical protein